jgi:hypothetical protein
VEKIYKSQIYQQVETGNEGKVVPVAVSWDNEIQKMRSLFYRLIGDRSYLDYN